MTAPINPHVARAIEPPTGETRVWLDEGPRHSTLPVIDASQAVPSYPPAQELMEHLSRFVLTPESAFYTPILGIPALRAGLAADLSQDYRCAITSDHVAISSGGNHAFCMSVLATAGHGDDVILAEPYYFNHQMWLDMQGIGIKSLKCRETSSGMLPTVEDAEKLIGPRTKLIILISPNNPTGTIYPPELLRDFLNLARRHELALVVDETYKDFLPGDVAHSLFEEPGWEEAFIHLYSFSKAYSLTGYRVGAVVAGRPILDAVSKVADTLTICAPRVGQEAALYGLEHLGEWRAEKRRALLKRIDHLDGAFAEHKPPFELISRGAFFAYLRHPFKGETSLSVSRRLFDDLSLVTWPGSFFGTDQEDYIRLAFANSDTGDITEMARRLATVTA